MAIMMIYTWDGTTAEQYDAVRAKVDWLGNAPQGGRVHVAAFSDRGLRITDVWDSVEDLQAFVAERLQPAIDEVGIPGQPTIEILPLHESYCPVADTVLLTPVA